MSPLDSIVPSVLCGISKRLQPKRIMLFVIKLLVLTISLISFTATADIIVQPGYGKVPTQPSSIHSQSLVKPSEKPRESEFGHTAAQLVPVYLPPSQSVIPYQVGYPLQHYPHYPHYPYYPHYPQYAHTWPRYAPQRHLRVLKIGGRKVFQPSLFVGHQPIPTAVHHRYKKSIGSQPDSGKSGETVPNSEDSSVNKFRSDMTESKDEHIVSSQSKNDLSTTGGLFGLNKSRFLDPANIETEVNTQNERNANENYASSAKDYNSNVDKSNLLGQIISNPQGSESNSQILPDEPNLGNFPDPRPDKPEHKTSQKTTANPTAKSSQEKNPILGSPITRVEISEAKTVQQEYPMPSSYNYNYNPLLYGNHIPPLPNYQPIYVVRYGSCKDGTTKMFGDLQSAIQEEINNSGSIQAICHPRNMGYGFLPQSYNSVTSYGLGYPMTTYYASPPYPIPYTQP